MTTWFAPELVPLAARLAPHARASFDRAAFLAARIHAEEISPEHWLAALLADEECAATRVVLHAFADPETIGVEVLALCAGIMVVGSERTLPFSVLSVAALRAARAAAAERASARVEPFDLFRASIERVPEELRRRVALLPGAVLELPLPPSTPGDTVVSSSGPLFRQFSAQALRSLGASCRCAASVQRSSIAPAHVVVGTLEVDAALARSANLSASRVRMAASGLDDDETPLPERRLAGEERLCALLERLPEQAETLDVLALLLAQGSEELTSLLRRQKVTSALVERCRGTYHDPPGP